MGNSPCYKCEERHTGCHGSCLDYAAFSERNSAATKSRYEHIRADRAGRYGAEVIRITNNWEGNTND